MDKIRKKGVFFLDGLDEVGEKVTALNKIKDTLFHSVSVIIATRPEYQFICMDRIRDLRVLHFEVMDEWRKIPEAWLAKEDADKFIKEIKKNQVFSRFLEYPLFLTYACILYRKEKKIPETFTSLIKKFVKYALWKWSKEKDSELKVRMKSMEGYAKQIMDVLSEIAWEMFSENKDGIKVECLREKIENVFRKTSLSWEDILRLFEASLLVCDEVGEETIYYFFHRSFVEFFSAWYWKGNGYMDFVKGYYCDFNFWNIIIFLSGLLEDATEMVEFLEENGAVELAAYCVREGRVKKEVIDKVVNDLMELVRMEIKCEVNLPWLPDAVFAVREHVEVKDDWDLDFKLVIADYISSVEDLQKMFEKHNNPDVAEAVARALGEIGEKEGIGLLERIFDEKHKDNPDVARAVAWALGEIGEREGIKLLKKIFEKHKDKLFVARNVAWALGKISKIGERESIEKLEEIFERHGDDVAWPVVWALGRIGEKEDIGLLEKIFEHEYRVDIALAVVEALGKIGERGGIDLLEKIFKEHKDKPFVPSAVALALGEIGEKEGIGLLERIFEKHKDKFAVAEVVARALGKIGEREGIELLKRIFEEHKDKPFVARNVAWALGKISKKERIEFLKYIVEEHKDDLNVVWAVARALGRIGEKEDIGLLEKIFKVQSTSGVAREVAYALGKIGEREGIDVLKKILEEYEYFPDVARAVAWALGEIGEREGIELLKKIFEKHKDKPDVVEVVAEALGEIGEKKGIGLLKKIFKTYKYAAWVAMAVAEVNVSQAVVRALGKIGEREGIELLEDIFEDHKEHPDVIKVVAEALGEIGERESIEKLEEIVKMYGEDVGEVVAHPLEKIGLRIKDPEKFEDIVSSISSPCVLLFLRHPIAIKYLLS